MKVKNFLKRNDKQTNEMVNYSIDYLDKIFNKARYTTLDLAKLTVYENVTDRIIVSTIKRATLDLQSYVTMEYNDRYSNKKDADYSYNIRYNNVFSDNLDKLEKKGWSDRDFYYIYLVKDLIILSEIANSVEIKAMVQAVECCTGYDLYGEKINPKSHFSSVSTSFFNSEFTKLVYVHALMLEITKLIKFKYTYVITENKIKNLLEYVKTNCKDAELLKMMLNVENIEDLTMDNLAIFVDENTKKEIDKNAKNFYKKGSVHADIDYLYDMLLRL